MDKVLLVGLGGFAGAVARYGLTGAVHRLMPGTAFPLGTLAVNLLGCLAIGLLAGVAEGRGVFPPPGRAFLFIGLLGGFTTFSTLGYESFQMIRDGQWAQFVFYAGAQLVLGVTLVWAGFAAARWAWGG